LGGVLLLHCYNGASTLAAAQHVDFYTWQTDATILMLCTYWKALLQAISTTFGLTSAVARL
jgi:hypothetical protein